METPLPGVIAAALVAAGAGAAAADTAADPRGTYSTNGWELVWNDEFDGDDPLGFQTKWIQEVGFVRNRELQYYTANRAENLRVEDGSLVFTVRKETWPNADFGNPASLSWSRERSEAKYTSASVESRRTFLYGRIEFRAQMPRGQGAWPALWFLGDTWRKSRDDPEYLRWPLCGEIDLVEVWGHDPEIVQTSLHTARRGPEPGEAGYSPRDHYLLAGGEQSIHCRQGQEPWNGFHTYTLDWYEDRMFMFYDGILFGSVDLSVADRPDGRNSFREPAFAIMNVALGGGNPAKRNFVFDEDTALDDGTVVPAARFPMEMKVDWVRHYRRAAHPKENGRFVETPLPDGK